MCQALTSIIHPEPLAKDAVKELRAQGAQRTWTHGAPNFHRDFQATVNYFDPIWRALVQIGQITNRTPQRGQTHATALMHEER